MEELDRLRALLPQETALLDTLDTQLRAAIELAERVKALEAALAEQEAVRDAEAAERQAASARWNALVERYRNVVAATLPEPARALLTGQTAEEIDQAAAAIRATVEALAARPPLRPPLGAPARGALDPETLSAREKIVLGLGRK